MPLYAYRCHVEIDLRADHVPRTELLEDLKRNRSEEKIWALGADYSNKVLDSTSAKSEGVKENWAQFVSDQEKKGRKVNLLNFVDDECLTKIPEYLRGQVAAGWEPNPRLVATVQAPILQAWHLGQIKEPLLLWLKFN